MAKLTLRQEVFDAAVAVLGDRSRAEEIAAKFAEQRAAVSGGQSVSEATRKAIADDLRAGGWSYSRLRDKHGVGISTVQRVASDLKAQGVTVRTAGQTLLA